MSSVMFLCLGILGKDRDMRVIKALKIVQFGKPFNIPSLSLKHSGVIIATFVIFKFNHFRP